MGVHAPQRVQFTAIRQVQIQEQYIEILRFQLRQGSVKVLNVLHVKARLCCCVQH